MAQADGVVANGTGAAVRSDLNGQLAALFTNHSGSTEPSTTYAYQFWADTNANVLKIRNSANNAWITLRELDGTMLIEDGSASTPGLAFADDVNTGIFSPAADQIGFATGGAERLEIGSSEVVFNDPSNDVDFRVESNGLTHALFVDAGNDRIGVGQSSPGYRLDVDAGSTTSGGLRISGSSSPQIRLEEGSGVTASLQADSATGYVGTISNHPFVIRQNASERARIDTSGRLLVGLTSSSSSAAAIFEGFSGSPTGQGILQLQVGKDNAATANNENLGSVRFANNDGAIGALISSEADAQWASSDYPGRLTFHTTPDNGSSPTERARIDSSGNMGIGESAPLGKLHVKTADSGASSVGVSADEFVIENSGNAGMTILSGTTNQGLINFGDSGDVNVGNITYDHNSNFMSFKTNDSERVRIASDGFFASSNTGSISTGADYHKFTSNVNTYRTLAVFNVSNTSGDGTYYSYLNTNGNNTSSYHFVGGIAGIDKILIYGNGNIVNVNNSYGSLSDVKLKENIVDASSQWDDIKGIRVRNYNFIEGQTHTQIGVVAQEIETVSPGLVTESPDRDEEGNDLGTVTKSVNYSVLYMKAVKALQEAMDRIETLEAKVAALEAG